MRAQILRDKAHRSTIAAMARDHHQFPDPGARDALAVQLEAALLEIGAAADRCRRGIVDTPDTARSVEDLLQQLRADQTRASDAINEVTRRKNAAAAGRQRIG